MHMSKKPSGYITLISTLIVGAVVSLIATSLILLGMGTSRSSFVAKQGSQAKAFANACAEEALQQIRNSDQYSGNGNLVFDGGECNYSVTINGGESRSILATGNSNNMIRKVEINVSTLYPSLGIDSWLES